MRQSAPYHFVWLTPPLTLPVLTGPCHARGPLHISFNFCSLLLTLHSLCPEGLLYSSLFRRLFYRLESTWVLTSISFPQHIASRRLI